MGGLAKDLGFQCLSKKEGAGKSDPGHHGEGTLTPLDLKAVVAAGTFSRTELLRCLEGSQNTQITVEVEPRLPAQTPQRHDILQDRREVALEIEQLSRVV